MNESLDIKVAEINQISLRKLYKENFVFDSEMTVCILRKAKKLTCKVVLLFARLLVFQQTEIR